MSAKISVTEIPTHKLNLTNIVTGYPRLAQEISRQPELGIFRSFAALNAQDILYLQAEIIFWEKELRIEQKKDSEEPGNLRPNFNKDWLVLEYGAFGPNKDEAECRQHEIMLRLRHLLHKYSV